MPANNLKRSWNDSTAVVGYPLEVDFFPPNATVTKVDATDVATILQPANTYRRGLFIFNNSNCTLYVKLGVLPTSISYTDLVPPYARWVLPVSYTGQITGFWVASNGLSQMQTPGFINGSAMVTELTTN